jgi:hypothetical protein
VCIQRQGVKVRNEENKACLEEFAECVYPKVDDDILLGWDGMGWGGGAMDTTGMLRVMENGATYKIIMGFI